MSTQSDTRPVRPLAARIAAMVMAVCAGCALLAMLVQGGQVWFAAERENQQALEQITAARMPDLTAALWDIDPPTLRQQVDEIAHHPQVAGVRLVTAGGQVFSAGRVPPALGATVLDVPHPPPGGSPLGQLTIAFNHRYLDAQMGLALLQTALGIGVFAALIAALVIRFLRRELTEPLRHITEHARRLSPGDAAQELTLGRPERAWRDDINLLGEAFVALQGSLHRYAGERNEALQRLAEERDHLDATVRHRTVDLTRVNRFLADVTQLSARLIDLPVNAYPQALREVLAHLAATLDARACAIAEAGDDRDWCWRLVASRGADAPIAEGESAPLAATTPMDEAAEALGGALRLPVWAWGHHEGPQAGTMLVVLGWQTEAAARGEELQLMAQVLFSALAHWRNLLELDRTREQLEHQNEALKESVRLREEMERIGRHDLKTPLNTIIAVPRLLRERQQLQPDDEELLGIVERAGYRILNLVNLSLDLFRMEQGNYALRPQAVDLLAVLANVVADVRAHAKTKGLTIRVLVDGGAVPDGEAVHVWAEDLLCYSILANLMKNAIEAAPEGSPITVDLRRADPLLLSMHNLGAVPVAVRESFFEKYATAGKSDGTGLGTYSAWLMARIQGGSLSMHTSEAEGTTLELRLQQASPEQVRAVRERDAGDLRPMQVHPEALPCWRVLAVDDDEYNLLVMRRYMPSPPLTVFTAVNGRAGVETALQRQPDLVLIDLDMPVMNGLEATRRLRAHQRDGALKASRIVMLSSHDDDATRQLGVWAAEGKSLTAVEG